MKEITIGKLGNQPFPITDETVSRHHAILRMEDNGRLTITDTHSANGTYIKMKDGSFKRISQLEIGPNCILRLGPTLVVKVRDLLQSNKPPQPTPTRVDITALRYMMMHYQKNKMELEQKKSTNGLLRMLMMPIATLSAMVLPTVIKSLDDNISQVLVYASPVCVLLVCFLFFLLLNNKNKELIRKQAELDQNFHRNYCCPKCHCPFGNRLYEHILNEGQCPKCKSAFYETCQQDI